MDNNFVLYAQEILTRAETSEIAQIACEKDPENKEAARELENAKNLLKEWCLSLIVYIDKT